MLEKIYDFSVSDKKIIERLIDDDNLAINHMILPKGTGLPQHNANSNVYMIIVRGILTLKLDDQEPQKYKAGQIVNIPYDARMDANNNDEGVLELFVVKSPNPRHYGGK